MQVAGCGPEISGLCFICFAKWVKSALLSEWNQGLPLNPFGALCVNFCITAWAEHFPFLILDFASSNLPWLYTFSSASNRCGIQDCHQLSKGEEQTGAERESHGKWGRRKRRVSGWHPRLPEIIINLLFCFLTVPHIFWTTLGMSSGSPLCGRVWGWQDRTPALDWSHL